MPATCRHCSIAEARNDFSALREMRWRSTLKVLWTAARTDKNRCADPGDLNGCIFLSRRLTG